MLTLLLLLLSPEAQASCSPAAVELLPLEGSSPAVVRERWTWYVEDGWPDCVEVDLHSPLERPILGLQLWHQPFERKARELSPATRAAHSSVGPSGAAGARPGLTLHTPELRFGDTLVVEALRPAVERPLDTRPAALPDTEVQVLATLLPARKPLRGLAQDGESRTARLFLREGAQPARQTWPPEASEAWCTLLDQGSPCPEDGLWAWALPEQGRVAWGYLLDRADASGRVELAPAADSSFVWLVPDAQIAMDAPRRVRLDDDPVQPPASLVQLPEGALPPAWVEALAESAPLTRQYSARERELETPTPVSWRLASVDGRPVLADRNAAEQAVAWLAVRASMPEPSLPNELRGLLHDPDEPPHATLTTITELLGEQVHPGSLPGARSLFPRPLMKVRRSGWANPWEQALVLARTLRQLKFDALPVPARPRALGEPDEASLADWPLAVVVVRHAQGAVVLDPRCRTCAPGQLRPQLDGAWLLSPGVRALPALAPSSLVRAVEGEELSVVIDGPLVLALREQMAARPPAERPAFLARLLVGEDATLASHEGLSQASASIRLRFTTTTPTVPLSELALLAGPARGRFVHIDGEGIRTEIEVEQVDPGTEAWVRQAK
mgnify:CR=1 FL=1